MLRHQPLILEVEGSNLLSDLNMALVYPKVRWVLDVLPRSHIHLFFDNYSKCQPASS